MKTIFDQSECQNLKNALGKEWLETNGLGGFASSTIIGAPIRGGNMLLDGVAAPPVERHVLLAKFEERVLAGGHESSISTNLYLGTIFPHGFNRSRWTSGCVPGRRFGTRTMILRLRRACLLVHGENTVVVSYRQFAVAHTDRVEAACHCWRSAITMRWPNEMRRWKPGGRAHQRHDFGAAVRPTSSAAVFLHEARRGGDDCWRIGFSHFTYPWSRNAGLDFQEDLFTPFELSYKLTKDRPSISWSLTEKKSTVSAEDLIAGERQRRKEFETRP